MRLGVGPREELRHQQHRVLGMAAGRGACAPGEPKIRVGVAQPAVQQDHGTAHARLRCVPLAAGVQRHGAGAGRRGDAQMLRGDHVDGPFVRRAFVVAALEVGGHGAQAGVLGVTGASTPSPGCPRRHDPTSASETKPAKIR